MSTTINQKVTFKESGVSFARSSAGPVINTVPTRTNNTTENIRITIFIVSPR